MLVAVLGGALFLQDAQQLAPVYVAARDLSSGTVLAARDLAVVRVRLPGPELRHYLRPAAGGPPAGLVLTAPVPRDALVPAVAVAASARDAGMVELPIKADAGDIAQGLRPGGDPGHGRHRHRPRLRRQGAGQARTRAVRGRPAPTRQPPGQLVAVTPT